MKKYIISSFLSHLCAIIVMLLLTNNIDLKKRFIVYGAHSKKPTQAYFKPIKNCQKTNWLQKRQELEMKNKNKKSKIKTKHISKSKPKQKAQPQKKTIVKKKQTIHKETPSQKKTKHEIKLKNQEKKIIKEENELHFNVLDKYDPALAKYHKHIQKEVERVWHPPIGVPKGTECSILFHIDKKGNVKHFEIKKRSHVLIYDLSIIRIAKNFHFDSCLWNKKFTIDFRQ